MNDELLSGSLLPRHVTTEEYSGTVLIDRIAVASSNRLRALLGLHDQELVQGAAPDVIVGRQPTGDCYCADLLLRACYADDKSLPQFGEYTIRGERDDPDADLNPRLRQAALIGLAGNGNQDDFQAVYDECPSAGVGSTYSATNAVFRRHLESFQEREAIGSLQPLFEEVEELSACRRLPYDHLFAIIPKLHSAQFHRPASLPEYYHSNWKRAICEALLMSAAVTLNQEEEEFDNERVLHSLENEWKRYLRTNVNLSKKGYLGRIELEAVNAVTARLFRCNEFELCTRDGEQRAACCSVRRLFWSLQQVWRPEIVSFIMAFLFEALLQAEQAAINLPLRHAKVTQLGYDDYTLLHYTRRPFDQSPQIALLRDVNKRRIPALVVIYDPVLQSTTIYRGACLFNNVWLAFCDLLLQREGESVWRAELRTNGQYDDLICNGSASCLGAERTCYEAKDFSILLGEAIDTAALAVRI